MGMSGSSHGRLHVVMVPGFAGFDALGQLEYYAGVTPLFRKWQRASKSPAAVLHYFDNFPTAAVVTRAGRLRQYLAKRIARGEFCRGDSVALVGHSTGGLDIRRLLWDLAACPGRKLPVDGVEDIEAREILDFIDRVVFLSVPQWGTNIAYWVRQNVLGRALVVAQLRASVAASQTPLLCRLQDLVSRSAAAFMDVDLLHAVQDALCEAEARPGSGPARIAGAHEAASELELWLRHMAWDFAAIDDLTPPQPGCGEESPAHFSSAARADEVAQWKEYGIQTRSYATVSPRPFRFEPGRPAPVWDLLKPWTWPDFTGGSGRNSGTDLSYRYCYRACAGGPFSYPDCLATLDVESWDSDGIVNTASMLWPDGNETVLVPGDHEDIVGHYHRVRISDAPDGREYRAYDLLKSGSGFENAEFSAVWTGVFDFCGGSQTSRRRGFRAVDREPVTVP
jgi:hypothetical protein